MFPCDSMPVAYLEVRDEEMKAKRKAAKERAAANFAQQGALALQSRSACSTPLPSPGTNFGFVSGFFSNWARTAENNSPPFMSRSQSSPGHVPTLGSNPTSAPTLAPTSAPANNTASSGKAQ